jgi:hypothetical protein
VVAGSPRIDLWRPEMIQAIRRDQTKNNGHILVVSSITPFLRVPFWVGIHNWREGRFGPSFEGDDDPREFAQYDEMSSAYAHVKHVTRAVRELLRRYPEMRVVFRPHHFEEPNAWVALLGVHPNLTVDVSSTSRQLVARASVVIQCGSSIALESSVAQRPVVTFCPVEGPWSDWASNGLGQSATTQEDLINVVGAVLAGDSSADPVVGRALLASRLAALEGPLASDRIVDRWEWMLTPTTSGRIERIVRRRGIGESLSRPLRGVLKAAGGVASRRTGRRTMNAADKGPFAMEVEHKFPALDVDALRADAKRLSDHLGRFQDVEIIRIGEREVLLRAGGR